MQNTLFKKGLVVGIIFLFIGASVASSTGRINLVISKTTGNDGSLLGYVNGTSGNPIEGALIRVHFHGTYEEDYSDEDGYYHVINIPICYCMKNATCSKEGYKTEWELLSIAENTTYDFILDVTNHPPEPPIINGPHDGKVGEEYIFMFKAVDPENQNVSFYIEWGDGTSDEWSDYVESGVDKEYLHTWFKQDDYFIRCKAKDIYNAESDWSDWTILISKNKVCNLNFLGRQLERFMNLLTIIEL